MTPIQFLVSHRDSDSSRADLARALLECGRKYGAARDFNRDDLVRWFVDGVKRPRWFYQAALDIALENGWTITTRQSADMAVATLRSRQPTWSLPHLKKFLAMSIVDERLVDDAWTAATLSLKGSA